MVHAHYDALSPLEGGMCLSAFLISINEDGLLMGRMQDPEAWAALEPVQNPEETMAPDRWVLPAAHLREGEHPDAAAQRLAAEQLEGSLEGIRLSHILSFAYPYPPRDQEVHWDLCFIYDVDVELGGTPAHFAELRRVPILDVDYGMFARGHGDVLAELNLVDGPE